MDIVEEIRTDREKGARRLESEYRNGLRTLAMRFCQDPGDADELVNRTFAEVVANIDRYAEQSAFFGWMSKILVNLHAKDVRRKSNDGIVYSGDLPDIADMASGKTLTLGPIVADPSDGQAYSTNTYVYLPSYWSGLIKFNPGAGVTNDVGRMKVDSCLEVVAALRASPATTASPLAAVSIRRCMLSTTAAGIRTRRGM